ncbi:MAG TPA: hypothetical protein VN674_08525, partial [Gemmatimonadales bacterium]|nr:hypothetical protein [Gemmatimonadales bacterium]
MTRSQMVRSALAGAGVVVLLGGGLIARAWMHRPLAAPPVVVTAAYREYSDTLRRDETLGDLLQRAG